MEIEEQQLKQIKAEQAEHAVIRTANDTNETAKEVKVVAGPTDKPLLIKTKSTGSQSAQAYVRSTSNQSDTKHTAAKRYSIPIRVEKNNRRRQSNGNI